MSIKVFEFANSQECWEGLNEYFFNKEREILKEGGSRYGSQLIQYNVFAEIRKAWVDPEFDYGNTFGYRIQKWTGLVNNYVNLNYLDLLKSEIVTRESKSYAQYNVSMQFDNSHGHGKNCLLSVTFSRRADQAVPIVSFTLRSSEITKRLLLDLLLVQRLGEYIYGESADFKIFMYVVNMYQNAESFTMYDIHKKFKDIIKVDKKKGMSPWQERIMNIHDNFSKVHPDKIKYKVFKRAVNQLQNVYGDKPLLTKDLALIKKDIEYPEDCITTSQRRAYKRKLKKDGKIN